ncbi:hypothetical protein B0J17DRAFT_634160 [Rhizoctonia solani]|nr:hypothetical protein B0J17DRAFT_634160 [Rhizoctonia solani]
MTSILERSTEDYNREWNMAMSMIFAIWFVAPVSAPFDTCWKSPLPRNYFRPTNNGMTAVSKVIVMDARSNRIPPMKRIAYIPPCVMSHRVKVQGYFPGLDKGTRLDVCTSQSHIDLVADALCYVLSSFTRDYKGENNRAFTSIIPRISMLNDLEFVLKRANDHTAEYYSFKGKFSDSYESLEVCIFNPRDELCTTIRLEKETQSRAYPNTNTRRPTCSEITIGVDRILQLVLSFFITNVKQLNQAQSNFVTSPEKALREY